MGVLEKISALKIRLYSLANENSQKLTKTYELCISATDCNGVSVTERSFRAILRGLGWWKSFCSWTFSAEAAPAVSAPIPSPASCRPARKAAAYSAPCRYTCGYFSVQRYPAARFPVGCAALRCRIAAQKIRHPMPKNLTMRCRSVSSECGQLY